MERILIFATGNAHKVDEVRAITGDALRILTPAELGLTGLSLPETAETLEGNAMMKACALYDHVNRNCFAEDTGLEVDTLDGRPGVYSARYAGDGATPPENMTRLLEELDGLTNRKARFRAVIALILEKGLFLFEGVTEGHIAETPQGTGGFGYDPVFIPNGYTQTFAQLGEEVKHMISHRAQAMHKMLSFLNTLPHR